MALALAPKKTLRERSRKVKSRKICLRKSGHRYRALAKMAGVSYWMAWKWINDERRSAKCEAAFNYLVGHPASGE